VGRGGTTPEGRREHAAVLGRPARQVSGALSGLMKAASRPEQAGVTDPPPWVRLSSLAACPCPGWRVGAAVRCAGTVERARLSQDSPLVGIAEETH
jgi:hypothetical protein